MARKIEHVAPDLILLEILHFILIFNQAEMLHLFCIYCVVVGTGCLQNLILFSYQDKKKQAYVRQPSSSNSRTDINVNNGDGVGVVVTKP